MPRSLLSLVFPDSPTYGNLLKGIERADGFRDNTAVIGRFVGRVALRTAAILVGIAATIGITLLFALLLSGGSALR